MAENTNDSQVVETEEELTNYTTETNAGAGTGTSAIEPGYGTGRRKEAVARVRLVPGDGKWTHILCICQQIFSFSECFCRVLV